MSGYLSSAGVSSAMAARRATRVVASVSLRPLGATASRCRQRQNSTLAPREAHGGETLPLQGVLIPIHAAPLAVAGHYAI
jgi:hypothetical protein